MKRLKNIAFENRLQLRMMNERGMKFGPFCTEVACITVYFYRVHHKQNGAAAMCSV